MCHGEKASPSSYKPFPSFLFSPKPRSTDDTEGRTGHHELLLALHLLHKQREYWDIGSLSLWQKKFYFTRKATDASQICQTIRRIHIQVKPGNIQVARNHSGSIKTSCGLLHLGIFLILGISLISGSQINTVAGFYLSPSLVLGRAGRQENPRLSADPAVPPAGAAAYSHPPHQEFSRRSFCGTISDGKDDVTLRWTRGFLTSDLLGLGKSSQKPQPWRSFARKPFIHCGIDSSSPFRALRNIGS